MPAHINGPHHCWLTHTVLMTQAPMLRGFAAAAQQQAPPKPQAQQVAAAQEAGKKEEVGYQLAFGVLVGSICRHVQLPAPANRCSCHLRRHAILTSFNHPLRRAGV